MFKRLYNERRVGLLYISAEIYDLHPEIVWAIQSRVMITRAEPYFDLNPPLIQLTGYSEDFQQNEINKLPTHYRWTYNFEDNSLVFTVDDGYGQLIEENKIKG